MARYLDVQLIEKMFHPLAVAHFDNQYEPIPAFSTRELALLESALNQPRQTFGGEDLYQALCDKAAILFYLMVKNHPFKNGNKRIAMTALLSFLHKNKKWLEVDNQELYNFAKWVAESHPKFKDQTTSAIEKFIKTYIVNL